MIYGADTKQLRELAASFALTAQTLRDTSGSLSRTVSTTPWRGGDADQFRTGWQMVNRARMESAAGAIEDASAALRRNADEQDRASGVMGEESGAQTGDFGGAIPSADASREDVESWWNGLSPEEQEAWMRDRPAQLGNRDGIPLDIRYAANQSVVQRTLEGVDAEIENLVQRINSGEASSTGALERLEELARKRETLRSLVEMRQTDGDQVEILHFDMAAGQVAVVHGDLKTASEVVVTVPGTGANLDKFVTNFGPEGEMLEVPGRAVISSLVWDPPPGLTDNVAIEHYTQGFVDGPINSIIATAEAEAGTVALVGHSAGAIAVQEFMTSHHEAARMVDSVSLLAPPALNPHLPDVLDGRNLFVAMNDNDPLRLVDGNEDVRDGLRWEGVASIDDIIKGDEPWTGRNISWDSQPSGLGGVAYTGGHHGNSTYFSNYGDGISGAIYGELANQDELSF